MTTARSWRCATSIAAAMATRNRSISTAASQQNRRSKTHYAKARPSGSYQGCEAYNDFREVLARDDIDTVVIAAPDHWHCLMTVQAAEAGKDIYCEKPLGLTIGDGQAMVKAVRKHNRILQTGSHERSNPNVRRACRVGPKRSDRQGEAGRRPRGQTQQDRPRARLAADADSRWIRLRPVAWAPLPRAPYHKDRCLYNFRFHYDYAGGQITNLAPTRSIWPNGGSAWTARDRSRSSMSLPTICRQGSLFNAATYTNFRCTYANGVVLECRTAEPSVRCIFEGTEGVVRVDNQGQNFLTIPEEIKRATANIRGSRKVRQQRRPPAQLPRLCEVAQRTRRLPWKSVIAAPAFAIWAISPCKLKTKLKWNPDSRAVCWQRRGQCVDSPARAAVRGRILEIGEPYPRPIDRTPMKVN